MLETLRKPGPLGLPVYAWVGGIGALGVGLFVFWRQKNAAAKDAQQTGNAPAGAIASDYPGFTDVPFPYPVDNINNPPPGSTDPTPITVPPTNASPPAAPAPKPAPPPPAPAPTQPTRYYTVVSGDTLWGIATRYYGSGSQWPKIYAANVGVIGPNPNLIYPGQRLRIPY